MLREPSVSSLCCLQGSSSSALPSGRGGGGRDLKTVSRPYFSDNDRSGALRRWGCSGVSGRGRGWGTAGGPWIGRPTVPCARDSGSPVPVKPLSAKARELLSGARVSVEGAERFSRTGKRRKEGAQSPSWGQEFREAMDGVLEGSRLGCQQRFPCPSLSQALQGQQSLKDVSSGACKQGVIPFSRCCINPQLSCTRRKIRKSSRWKPPSLQDGILR